MRRFSLSISGSSCAACGPRMNEVLRNVPGVEEVTVPAVSQKAFLVCKDDISLQQIEKALKRAGFLLPCVSMNFQVQGDLFYAQKLAEKIFGVRRAEVRDTNNLHVELYPVGIRPQEIIKTLGMQGIEASLTDLDDGMEALHVSMQMDLLRRLVTAAVLTMPLMLSPSPWIQMVLGVLLLAGPGNLFLRGGIRQIRAKKPGMDLLTASSTTLIFCYSAYVTVTVRQEVKVYFLCEGILVCLLLLGRYLESAAEAEMASSLRNLIHMQPMRARVEREDRSGQKTEVEIGVEQIRPEDVIVCGPGERIPVDGVIISGTILVDASMMTGESVPVRCTEGDEVIAGTLNRSGKARIHMSHPGKETYLDQLIRLVETAQASGSRPAALADRIASKFIPAVFLAALFTFILWYFIAAPGETGRAILNACGVLVIACPCALGLAIPTSCIVGLGRGAELGILFRNADQLAGAGGIHTLVFDKTGTLTDGAVSFKENTDGSTNFSEFSVSKERIRPDAADTVRELKEMGIRVIMLTGDRAEEAGRIAAALGIDRVIADVRPDGKAAVIEKLKAEGKGPVAMAGDGINDAPALAASDVSFSIENGTDIAKDTAGILLPGRSLAKIPTAIALSREVNRNIHGNLLWALVYNLIAIPLAAAEIINPSLASAAMSFSSIAVLLHSLSLKKACRMKCRKGEDIG